MTNFQIACKGLTYSASAIAVVTVFHFSIHGLTVLAKELALLIPV